MYQPPVAKSRLTFGELEAPSCFWFTVFLALYLAGIAGQQLLVLERLAEFSIQLHQRTADAHTGCLCLPLVATAVNVHVEVVEVALQVYGNERFSDGTLHVGLGKVLFVVFAVHADFAFTLGEIDPRN